MKLVKLNEMTYSTTLGAMTLHGPHQVAKQSRTIRVSLTQRASSKSFLLEDSQYVSVRHRFTTELME